MKDRIRTLMESEGLSPKRMAEILDVQPSNISHLLSGRNKPGFDLIANILTAFPKVNPNWLILGKSPMYTSEDGVTTVSNPISTTSFEEPLQAKTPNNTPKTSSRKEEIERIVVFYNDGTYKSYTPDK